MTTNLKSNETINSTNKEETMMTKRGLTLINKETHHAEETTLDALDLETIIDLKELTKDVLRIMLEEENIILSNNEFKKTKRIDLINTLYAIMHPVVPEGTGCHGVGSKACLDNCTGCNDTKEPEKPVDNTDARAKTDKLLGLLKQYALYNESKGYGYTISSFMLQACILDAGAGVKKFKDHKITKAEAKMTSDVYKWLKDKGYIKPVVYSVKEDANVRIYMPEYNGRTESDKTKLIPYAKSAGYTAHQVTSFVVTLR